MQKVRPGEVHLKDGTVLPFGLCLWSTGVGPTPFTTSLPFAKAPSGRLAVDDMLRVMKPATDPAAAGKRGHLAQPGR